MGAESHKARHRYADILKGQGLDIGCGSAPITDTCDRFDREQGDAQYLQGVPEEKYDWIVSSHLLEHIQDPAVAMAIWWKALKVGGYMIILVPDEDLYEQGKWPSRYNSDHKHTFTTHKDNSWSPVSKNICDLLHCMPGHKLMSLTIRDTGYDYSKTNTDQTSGGAEAAVEMVVRKCPVAEPPGIDIINCHFINIDAETTV